MRDARKTLACRRIAYRITRMRLAYRSELPRVDFYRFSCPLEAGTWL